MKKDIEHHRSRINKLEQELRKLSSEQSDKIKEMSKKKMFIGINQPINRWIKKSEGYKEMRRLKRKIWEHFEAIQKIERPRPKSFFEKEGL